MPETDSFTKAGNIIAFIVSFMYTLTVRLTVELLKFMILFAILIVSSGIVVLGFVSLILWAYAAYDSSVVAAACAGCLGVLLIVVAHFAIEFLVKDLMCLTDKPILHLVKICIVSLTGRGRRGGMEGSNQSSEEKFNSATTTDQQTKKNS